MALLSACPDCKRPTAKAIKTTCRACYQKRRYQDRPAATCHPARKEHAGGLCRQCYRLGGRAARATCHPDKLQVARGLCAECYRAEPDVKSAAVRARRLRKYKLSEQEYAALMEAQGWACAICKGAPEAVDHCHGSGSVRGLLCRSCNVGLGQFRDSPEFLKSAISYLEKHHDRSR